VNAPMTYPVPLAGKVALVIGGAGGIGAASARMLAEGGARVALTHRPDPGRADAAQTLAGSLAGEGHAALPADVADTATLHAAMRSRSDSGGSTSWSTRRASPRRCRMRISRA
jgi:NAD(P)-dependent dehydrogenase (short-subunit alcohol dehydrogenase family)